jgi:hypothetical protein
VSQEQPTKGAGSAQQGVQQHAAAPADSLTVQLSSASASSSEGGGGQICSTRARRLSFTGPCGGGPGAPTLGSTLSKASSATKDHSSGKEDDNGGSEASTQQDAAAGPEAQPASPDAHPLPERRVRFDSPVKTNGQREVPAAVTPPAVLAPVRTGTSPLPALAPAIKTSSGSFSSPSKLGPGGGKGAQSSPQSAAAAFAAAEARLRRGLPPGSPARAAAATAVLMSDVIHSVASLSRAGREPTYRKQNQVCCVHQLGGGGCCSAERTGNVLSTLLPCLKRGRARIGHLRGGARIIRLTIDDMLSLLCFLTVQDNCFAYSQYCRPNQALLATLDGHGPNGHLASLPAFVSCKNMRILLQPVPVTH